MTYSAPSLDFHVKPETWPIVESAIASRIEPAALEERKLELFNIYFVTSGTGTVRVNGATQDFNFGNVYIWKPGDLWSGQISSTHLALAVKFRWPGTKGAEPLPEGFIRLPRKILLKPEAQQRLKEIFDALIQCHLTKAPGWELLSTGYLYALLSTLMAESQAPMSDKPALDRRLSLAMSFMEQHLSDEISVREIAEFAHLSEDYFRRLFTRRMKVSPVKYLALLRIKAARRIIASEPNLTVSAVSRQVGFNDGRYFARIFRRHCGITPAAYRDSLGGPD
jgi:AraC-like DNA-binding protein